MSTPTGAPSVVTQRLAQLRADAAAANAAPPNTPPVSEGAVVPPAAPVAAPPVTEGTPPTPAASQGERVTLSREEYNQLQADAGRAATAAGRAEVAAMELEEARQRLTQLEAQGKGTATPPPPAAPSAPAPAPTAVDVSNITFTDAENEQFGESRPYIEKVARQEAARIVNELLPGLTSKIEEARNTAVGVATTVQTNASRDFLNSVSVRVPNVATLIKDKNWEAFLDSVEPYSGATFEVLLGHNIKTRNLDAVVAIYKAFESKYITPLPSNAAFNGASPSGSAVAAPPEVPNGEKLKLSDRKKASEDYKKNRITYEQLQEVDKKFKAAEVLGNVDYNS